MREEDCSLSWPGIAVRRTASRSFAYADIAITLGRAVPTERDAGDHSGRAPCLAYIYFADVPERRTATIISPTQIVATPVSMGAQLVLPAALSNASSDTVKVSFDRGRDQSRADGRSWPPPCCFGRALNYERPWSRFISSPRAMQRGGLRRVFSRGRCNPCVRRPRLAVAP